MRRKLLWIDCAAGALVGVLVLVLDDWLSKWYQLPVRLIFFMGIMNLVYASYSFSLALRSKRPIRLIKLLVFANLAWSLLLLVWVILFQGTATWLGLLYLILEAIFVATLALLQWRSRELLATA